MLDLPALALSVRQPWAWAIIHAGKDIETRSWQAVNHGLHHRGRIAIHAAKGMTRAEYEAARGFMQSLGIACPPPAELLRGGIIGTVKVIDVVKASASPWFFGPRGLVLAGPATCAFIPAIGQLGYFKWTASGAATPPPSAKWMTEAPRSPVPAEPPSVPPLLELATR